MDIKEIARQFYDYSIHIRGYSKETVRRYKYVIDYYCRIKLIERLDQATQDSVRDLLFYGRTQRNWSSNTAMVFHKSLMVFFRWCIQRGYFKGDNPVIGIEKPQLDQKIPRKLTKQEAIRLIEVVENYPYGQSFLRYRNAAMFSMFVFAGLRKNELLKLKYGDVDLENMTIFIRQGKGRKDRIVPITHTLATSLRRYLEHRKKRGIACPEFFTSLQYNKAFTKEGIRHLLEVIQPVAGIKFTIHMLRHTFATLMLEGGCDIYSLSKMMGHTDIKTTTIYLGATAEHLRAQMMKHQMNAVI
jgi:site-specific recombinase XerD